MHGRLHGSCDRMLVLEAPPHSYALTGRRRGAAQRGCYAVAPIQGAGMFSIDET